MRGGVLRVGFARRAVEDVVGGKMYQQRAGALRFGRKDGGRVGVDRLRAGRVGLGAVDGRIGSRVDDELRTQRSHATNDGVGIAKVEACAVVCGDLAVRREGFAQLESELSGGAGKQDRRARHG